MRRGDELVREGTDGYGALASMGGLWSSARDLARWVVELLDAFPARDDPEDGHPLRRATRREMQQVQRAIPPERAKGAAHAPSVVVQGGYGFGLFVQHDLELGTLVSHSGGYPGFGSYMGWHPASGLGVAALGNLRYAPLRGIGDERLRILVREEAAPRRRPTPLPAVERCRRAAEALLAAWDEGLADDEFAMNMDLDEPRERRRASVERIAAELGPFAPDPSRPVRSDSPADLTWWLRGARGWARVSILVSPEPEPRLQRLEVTAVPDPPAALAALAERVLRARRGRRARRARGPRPLAHGRSRDGRAHAPRGAGRGSVRSASGRRSPATGSAPPRSSSRAPTGRRSCEVGIDPATGAVSALWLGEDERAAPAEGW